MSWGKGIMEQVCVMPWTSSFGPPLISVAEDSSQHPSSCLGLCFGGNPSKTCEEGNCRLRTRYGGVESVRGILGSSGRWLEFFPQPKDPI